MPRKQEDLAEYRKKRDFGLTAEPRGRKQRSKGDPIFVVQKHDASRLHYDFRLEVDGVLKSWAVPKGPSLDPKDKRLAAATEDHPIEYAQFEGMIPEGEYGAGSVEIWDRGTYVNLTERDGKPVPMSAALQNNHVVFELKGERLRGRFALTRFGQRTPKQDKWLLVKMREGD